MMCGLLEGVCTSQQHGFAPGATEDGDAHRKPMVSMVISSTGRVSGEGTPCPQPTALAVNAAKVSSRKSRSSNAMAVW